MKDFVRSLIVIIIAILLTGLGVVLFVQANLGSDTITVFVDGLHCALDVSLGTASRIYNIIVLIIALLLSRKDIGWMTIVYALSVGYSIDFFSHLFVHVHINEMSMLIRLLAIVAGQLCFVVTYALMIKVRKGMNQMDAISYGIVRRTNISYKVIRTLFDVLLLAGGWLMGGVVGIGSVFTMATTGIMVNECVKLLEHFSFFQS